MGAEEEKRCERKEREEGRKEKLGGRCRGEERNAQKKNERENR